MATRTAPPPWLQAMLDEMTQQNAGPYAQTAGGAPPPPAPAGTTAATPAPVSGGDMAEMFAVRQLLGQQLSNQAANATARNQLASGVMFGRHLGIGGGEMTPTNPMGDPRDPFNNPAYFAGNPTSRAAQAIQAQPLWDIGPGGRLIHGTNYPGTVPPSAGPASETLPAMSPDEQATTLAAYSPAPDVFAERGLELSPTGNQLVKRTPRYVPPPPPPPPPQES